MGPASFWSVHFISEAGRLAHADRNGSRHATAWGVGAFLAAGIVLVPDNRELFTTLSVEENLVLPFRRQFGQAGRGTGGDVVGLTHVRGGRGQDVGLGHVGHVHQVHGLGAVAEDEGRFSRLDALQSHQQPLR